MDEKELRNYAREGARVQLGRILATFPDLAPPARPTILEEPPHGRRKLTPEEKRKISLRMKARWRQWRRERAR